MTSGGVVYPKVHLLHQVVTTIDYIVERQRNVKWVPNQRTAACSAMEKRHLLLHILMSLSKITLYFKNFFYFESEVPG